MSVLEPVRGSQSTASPLSIADLKGSPPQMRRILSIDGGGIRGAFAVSFLAGLEAAASHELKRKVKVGECFDLIAGTSTGGIIAIALGLGYSAAEVVAFFRQLGPVVFKGTRFTRLWRSLFAPRYSDGPLSEVVEGAFGGKLLSDSRVRLVIPALDIPTLKPRMFKTAHHPKLTVNVEVPLVHVAMSTAAAPTYFRSHRLASGVPLLDGGLVANNPAAVAAVEAIAFLGWQRGGFEILSVGCTSPPPPAIDASHAGRGLPYWGWRGRIIDVMLRAQSETSDAMARLLAGGEHVVRVDPQVAPRRFSLDGVAGIDDLCARGDSEARHALDLVRRFLASNAEPFTPFE